MTIENLKQIAIKYATTKGSRVPLAPDELCNAVVQYFNEFLKITADINTIQVAVTEEGGNIVFTITGNTLDGKAFTPIVITVDHNDFVTNQEFEEFKTSVTEQLNNKLNKITSPISNFVLYANIEGNDTQIRYTSGPAINSILYRDETGKTAVVKGVSGQDVANMENLSDITAKIPDVSGFATKEELKNVQNSLTNKRSVISSPTSSYVVYTQANGLESNLPYSELANQTSTNIMARRANGTSDVKKGISGENVANMENIADVESKIPDVSNFATTEDIPSYTDVGSVSYDITNGAIIAYDGAHEIHIPLLAGENVTIDASEDNKKIVISAAGGGGAGDVTAAGNNIFTGENEFRNYTYDTSNFCFVDTKEDYLTNGYTTTIKNGGFDISYYENGEGKYWTTYADNQIINKDIDMESEVVIKFPKKEGTFALTSDVPNSDTLAKLGADNTYTGTNTFNNSIYAKNGIVAGDTTNYGANSVTKGSNTYSFPNKSGIFALTSDVPNSDTLAILGSDNTYTGTNTFNNSIHAKNGIVAGDITNYGANSVTKGSNTYSFPNKSGTFAMTNDIINEPIYFISFYANAPSEPCHLIGTIMSKNSYGTGQKTNEEFAVMLADNLYANSNEGLAAYGRLANKDILCIYSEDGLSIRCLDEENSEVALPTVMFFVMETEL